MMHRSIILFPKFENMDLINEIRAAYDPLYSCIAPHITLVFPFESELTMEELQAHVSKQLQHMKPIKIIAKGITGTMDGYVFLDIKVGNDQIIELHDQLYAECLKAHLNRYIPYTPHITVGRLFDPQKHEAAVEVLSDFNTEFTTVIDSVYVECIGDNEESIIEFECKLKG